MRRSRSNSGVRNLDSSARICGKRAPTTADRGPDAGVVRTASFAEGLGLSDLEMDDALTYLLSFAQANARAAVDARAARVESAMTDEQWWAANAGLLAQVLDEEAYPLAVRVGSAAGAAQGSAQDPEHAYRFALQRLLDGLAAIVSNRQSARIEQPFR